MLGVIAGDIIGSVIEGVKRARADSMSQFGIEPS